jgi:hypothetical protein
MKLFAIILLVGLVVLGYAHSMNPYKDEALFMERYMALTVGQSSEYWRLRDEMLTPKFQLLDYGGTLIALSFGVLFVSRKGWRQIKSPMSRSALIGLALAAPILTVGAYAFDLLQGFARGEFPYWADSMSIPLTGVPVMLVLLLAWSGAHLAFFGRNYQSELLSQALSRQANWWLLAVGSITAMFSVLLAAGGQYWHAIAGVIWLYFYVSLAASRRSSHKAK